MKLLALAVAVIIVLGRQLARQRARAEAARASGLPPTMALPELVPPTLSRSTTGVEASNAW